MLLLAGLAAGDDRAEKTSEPLPRGAVRRLGSLRFLHGGPVRSLAISPDGKTIASGGYGSVSKGIIRLWNAETGMQIRALKGHGYGTYALAFSPNGNWLISGGTDRHLTVWEANTGKKVRDIKTASNVVDVAVSPDGRLVAACSGNRVQLFKLTDGKKVREIKGGLYCAFDPKGERIAAASGYGKGHVKLYRVSNGKELRSFKTPARGYGAVTFSPDGKHLSVGTLMHGRGNPAQVYQWNAETGKLIKKFKGGKGNTVALSYSPDGKLLASAHYGGTVRLWDRDAGRLRQKMDAGRSYARGVLFSPDGAKVFAAGHDGVIHAFSTETGKEQFEAVGHRGAVRTGKLIDGGAYTAGMDGTIRRWDLKTGKLMKTFAGVEYPSDMAISPDGTLLALGDTNHDTIRIVSAENGRKRGQVSDKGLHPLSLRFLSAEEVGVVGRTVLARVSARGKLLVKKSRGTRLNAGSGAIGPEGAYAVSTVGNAVWLSRFPDARTILALPLQSIGRGRAVSFGPLGQYVAIGGRGESGIFELLSGETMETFEIDRRKRQYCMAVSLNPTGEYLAIADNQGEIRICDAVTGKVRKQFAGHRGAIPEIAWSADSTRLMSVSYDTTALVWDTSDLRVGEKPRARVPAKQLRKHFAALASADGKDVYHASWALVRAGDSTVDLLDALLEPAEMEDPQRIRDLIAKLDAPQFGQREQAYAELAKLGTTAEPVMRRALKRVISLETEARLKKLLDALADPRTRPPESLRPLRAVKILERIGGKKARETVERLSEGAAEAPLTVTARSALERMGAR